MATQNNTIVVIGNGFDLNLGLPTSYQDFIKSPQFQRLLQTDNHLYTYLKDKYHLQNWVDIENELQKYSYDYTATNREEFRLEYNELCRCLCSYLNNVDLQGINKDSFAYKTLCNFINEEQVTIINFNYTDTVKHIIMDANLSAMNNGIEIYNIHGSALKYDIVFGVEDTAQINNDDVFLLKATQHAFKPIDLASKLEVAKNVVFLGHSLGSTDHHYFFKFFTRQAIDYANRKTIIITCYKEEGRLNIWKSIRKLTQNSPTELQIRNNVNIVDLETL